MPLDIKAVPMLSDNYAWMLHEPSKNVTAIVDPGDAKPVVELLGESGTLDYILLTHHHADHVGGADELRHRYGARIVGATADARRLPTLDIGVVPGEEISLGGEKALVIDTPGHTRGHIAFYFADADALFCGDTLFSLGCGRLFEGTAQELFESLKQLAALPDSTMVYAGHEYTEGNYAFASSIDPQNQRLQELGGRIRDLRNLGLPTLPSRLGLEKLTNPFLRAADAGQLGSLRDAKNRF